MHDVSLAARGAQRHERSQKRSCRCAPLAAKRSSYFFFFLSASIFANLSFASLYSGGATAGPSERISPTLPDGSVLTSRTLLLRLESPFLSPDFTSSLTSFFALRSSFIFRSMS